jgi:hypothetical protein
VLGGCFSFKWWSHWTKAWLARSCFTKTSKPAVSTNPSIYFSAIIKDNNLERCPMLTQTSATKSNRNARNVYGFANNAQGIEISSR